MIYQDLEERIYRAGRAFQVSVIENIIELLKEYLALLAEYRDKLYQHPGLRSQPASPSLSEEVSSLRKTIQEAIKQTEEEYSRLSELLHEFEGMNIREAVETLNQLKYKGHDTWRFSRVKVTNGSGHILSVEEALNAASLLRREEYIAQRAGSKG